MANLFGSIREEHHGDGVDDIDRAFAMFPVSCPHWPNFLLQPGHAAATTRQVPSEGREVLVLHCEPRGRSNRRALALRP